ncbi:hypothetical protein BgiBS90_034448 [Biomphalaria glabrata]|nr:hypothetical protein BgiBS90_034448 [Biomphalaria glabrata]
MVLQLEGLLRMSVKDRVLWKPIGLKNIISIMRFRNKCQVKMRQVVARDIWRESLGTKTPEGNWLVVYAPEEPRVEMG